MTTNNFFSFTRFTQIGCKLVVENKKTLIMRLVVMFGVILGLLCFASYNVYNDVGGAKASVFPIDPASSGSAIIFAVLLFCFGIYSASTMMEDLRTKNKRISALTTPVTPFENWLFRWIMQVVLFLGIYYILFFAADCLRTGLFSVIYSGSNLKIELLGYNRLIDALGLTQNESMQQFILFYLFVQAFYVMGSSFFPRHALLRTTVAGTIMLIVFVIGIILFYKLAIGDIHTHFVLAYGRAAYLILIVFCWAISYFRYKEIEVIDRF